MTERLPCPFCGHVGVTHNEGLTFRWLTTECNGCGAQCAEERINTMTMERSAAIEQAKVEALKTWNTRFTPFPPQQQAEPSQWRDMVVVSLVREGIDKHKARELADHFAAQQQAEPVAYFDFQELKFTWAKHMKISPVPVSIKVDPMKLYSEAPQRPWQGLTDEEIEAVVEQVANEKLVGTVQEFRIRFSRAIESKLKEKNND